MPRLDRVALDNGLRTVRLPAWVDPDDGHRDGRGSHERGGGGPQPPRLQAPGRLGPSGAGPRGGGLVVALGQHLGSRRHWRLGERVSQPKGRVTAPKVVAEASFALGRGG
jgi:hypothetical protein